jgi:hypothetical protein
MRIFVPDIGDNTKKVDYIEPTFHIERTIPSLKWETPFLLLLAKIKILFNGLLCGAII